MNQILRILRKDARLLWLEIALSLAVLLAFTAWEPHLWTSTTAANVSRQTGYSALLSGLLLLSWGILIVRLVQLERLAGLNQFWTSRPYEWVSLLAAKVLFVQLFIALPLGLAQALLLDEAHLPVRANLSPLLLNLVHLNGFFVLPMACVAALTVSFAQSAIVLLGVAVALAGATYAGWLTSWKLEPLFVFPLLGWVGATLLCAALLAQYSRRRQWLSAGFAVAAPVVWMLLHAALGGSPVALAPYGDPGEDSQGDAAVTIRFDTNPFHRDGRPISHDSHGDARVSLPLVLEPLPGALLNEEGRRFTFTDAQGYSWQTPWLGPDVERSDGRPIETGSKPRIFAEHVLMPAKVYERLRDGPVTVRVEFAMAEMREETPIRRVLSPVPEEIPGIGVCSARESDGQVMCLYPYHRQGLIRSPTKVEPCGTGVFESTLYFGGEGNGFVVSPILRGWLPGNACKDPVEFDTFRVRRRVLVRVAEAAIALKDYARPND